MDKGTIAGILLAIGGIVAGLLLEGGSLNQILQPTAAMIVFGGTLGAILIQFPLRLVLNSFRDLGKVKDHNRSLRNSPSLLTKRAGKALSH